VRDGAGDKSMNHVFDTARYKELLDGLDDATVDGGPAVYCGTGSWSVRANELYNIRAYDGVRICWIYNYEATSWKKGLPPTIQGWLDPAPEQRSGEAEALENFPYYATFGENRPRVIKLNPLQVSLLADLACWSVTNGETIDRVVGAFGRDMTPQ
jgi:hypothetical protein